MIIVAESGATKTDWRSVSEDRKVISFQTAGLNPMTMSYEAMREIISSAVPVLNPSGCRVEQIFFYGAGLVSENSTSALASILDMWCPFAQMEFHTDMEAAARAVFGDGSGVVAIMGTGSNSCLWQEGHIERNIRPGGFILGDEGSAASLGRMFRSDFIKGLVPEEIASCFETEFGLGYPEIVKGVYRSEAPSRFVASFARFVCAHKDDDYAAELIERNIRSFMERSLVRYGNGRIGVVGSFGCACRDEIERIGKDYGLVFEKFIQAPIEELVAYHS